MLRPDGTNTDESLSSFAPKVPYDSNTGWRMDEGAGDQDGLSCKDESVTWESSSVRIDYWFLSGI